MANDQIAAFLNAASGDILTLSEGSIYGYTDYFLAGVIASCSSEG